MQIDSIQWIIHAKDRARHIAQIRSGSLLLTQIRMDCDNSRCTHWRCRRLSVYSRVFFWHAFHVVRCARLVLLPFSWFVRIFQGRTWMEWNGRGGNERLTQMEKKNRNNGENTMFCHTKLKRFLSTTAGAERRKYNGENWKAFCSDAYRKRRPLKTEIYSYIENHSQCEWEPTASNHWWMDVLSTFAPRERLPRYKWYFIALFAQNWK